MTYDARAIANVFLDYAQKTGRKISLLSLLKIIYFAQGWHLAKFGESLIEQPFEAWRYGPVIRSVWEAFKDEADKAEIMTRAQKFSPETGSLLPLQECIDP